MNEAARSRGVAKKGLFARIAQFFREVLIEFKKVQRPTRSELWKMFGTVVSFILIIMAFIFVIDFLFNQGIFSIFA